MEAHFFGLVEVQLFEGTLCETLLVLIFVDLITTKIASKRFVASQSAQDVKTTLFGRHHNVVLKSYGGWVLIFC